MKVRIKFAKLGAMKFVGHLDLMRYFQKAMRRGGVAICYSDGFSPHQIMSFAAPLGVGLTSNGEYMDIEVDEKEDLKTLSDRLNAVMAEGVTVLSCRRLAGDSKNAMSIVTAADYTLAIRPEYCPENLESFFESLDRFYAQPSIRFVKKTKKSEREIDLKPLIYSLGGDKEQISMTVAAGSADNLKPELVMTAFYEFLGQDCPPFAFMIQREEVYADLGEEGHPRLAPLEEVGVYCE